MARCGGSVYDIRRPLCRKLMTSLAFPFSVTHIGSSQWPCWNHIPIGSLKSSESFSNRVHANKCIRQPNDGCSWHYEIFVREDCEAGSGFRPRDLSFAPFLFLHGPLNFIFHFNTSKRKKSVLNLKTRCCIYKYLWLCRKPNFTFLCLPLVCVRSMFYYLLWY